MNMTNEEYHSLPQISASDLKLIAKSPAKWRYRKENPMERTPALIMGSAIHTAIIEPHLFESEYVVAPKIDRRTKAGKEEYANFLKETEGKQEISNSDKELIDSIKTAYFANESARKLLENGKGMSENSFFWTDEEIQIDCRCRPDLVSDKAIIDLKTTQDASPEGFQRQAYNLGYDIQAAFYIDGLKANDLKIDKFVFIAIEKEAPFAIEIYLASEAFIAHGRKRYRAALAKYRACDANDSWYGYSPDPVNILTLPNWVKN